MEPCCVEDSLPPSTVPSQGYSPLDQEMSVLLPHDVLVCIIRDHLADKDTLCSVSLVSHSLCEIAQKALFFKVSLEYSTIITFEGISMNAADLPPFRFPKLEFLSRSEKILRYIRLFFINLTLDEPCHLTLFDDYWHHAEGRPVVDAIDHLGPWCLDRMSSLRMLHYSGPPLRASMHQAILRHQTLEVLEATVKTLCSVPCKQAVRSQKTSKLKKLQFMGIGNERDLPVPGCSSFKGGPRPCAFLSQMVLTHSNSLEFLKVPILLLYDALRASCTFPDFPNLTSLYIEDWADGLPWKLDYRAMSLVIVPFILHVHRNIVTLQWGRNMVEDVTKKITADHLPKLEAFTGYGIRYLIRTHSLKKLNLISLGTGDVVSGKTGHSLLVETSSCLPDLSVLSISSCTRTEALLRCLRNFTNLTELWYRETHDCNPSDEKSRDERSYALELVRIVVPALPKLRSLCITIKLTATGSWMQAEDLYRLRGTRARSLLIMTFQFIMKSAYYIRNDIYRETSKGRWKIRSFEGRDRMRKFTM